MLVTDSIPLTIFRFNVDLPDLLGNENQSFYFFFFLNIFMNFLTFSYNKKWQIEIEFIQREIDNSIIMDTQK